MIRPHIFRQYDIRGVVGVDLDVEVAEGVGRAFGTVLRRGRGGAADLHVALGRDNRPTSDDLADGVRRGLQASGVHVVSVGTVPTPVLSFAGAYLETDGAIQVTGSHNPPEYNGFKLSIDNRSIYGGAIQELRSLIEADDFTSGSGSSQEREIVTTYLREISRRFQVDRPVRVVVDCGNGTGSLVAVDLLRALGPNVEVVPLFCDSDPTFPNHHPDPVVDANLRDLIDKVEETEADFGVAFDGDADRIGAVDERGRIVRGDTLLAIYGLDLVARRGPGEPIVFDVKCSQALPEVLERAGARPIMSRTGHSLIKQRMKEEGALIAGELSGHIMFGEEYYGFDDALYGACLLVSIVARSRETLGERIDQFPQFVSTSEIRYASTESSKWEIVRDAVTYFSRDHEVVDVDGARVLFGDGWGLIRASNTEPVLVARYEAKTAARLAEIRSTMEDWLRERGVRV
jgi:phosphomannomutase / phosphoglucomutase